MQQRIQVVARPKLPYENTQRSEEVLLPARELQQEVHIEAGAEQALVRALEGRHAAVLPVRKAVQHGGRAALPPQDARGAAAPPLRALRQDLQAGLPPQGALLGPQRGQAPPLRQVRQVLHQRTSAQETFDKVL